MKTGEVQEAISKGSALRLVAGASIAILCLLNVYLGEILNEHHEASVALHSLLQFTGAADSFDRYSREPVPKPPFEAIVQGWNVTGDASWLLDFAIVGFPKCGTSSLMFHLLRHPQVSTFEDERCEISYNQQVKLMKDLYDKPPGSRRGIKCPMDLESTKLGMRNYDKYFPATDMIVGIRHPVLWFESFYNCTCLPVHHWTLLSLLTRSQSGSKISFTCHRQTSSLGNVDGVDSTCARFVATSMSSSAIYTRQTDPATSYSTCTPSAARWIRYRNHLEKCFSTKCRN